MEWIKKLFGKTEPTKPVLEPKPAPVRLRKQNVVPTKATEKEVNPKVERKKYALTRTAEDPLYDATFKAREEYWQKIGLIDDDVIAHMISPQFMGAPHWPTTRQAYKIIRTETTLIIASDGLSDPFTDCEEHEINSNGFENEVFIESSELKDASFDEIKKSWQFEAIEIWARNVANYGGLNPSFKTRSNLSVELPIHGLSEEWRAENGNVGFLVNLKPRDRKHEILDAPLSPISVIALTAIRPDELEMAIEGGDDGRNELATKFFELGFNHLSNENRESALN